MILKYPMLLKGYHFFQLQMYLRNTHFLSSSLMNEFRNGCLNIIYHSKLIMQYHWNHLILSHLAKNLNKHRYLFDKKKSCQLYGKFIFFICLFSPCVRRSATRKTSQISIGTLRHQRQPKIHAQFRTLSISLSHKLPHKRTNSNQTFN